MRRGDCPALVEGRIKAEHGPRGHGEYEEQDGDRGHEESTDMAQPWRKRTGGFTHHSAWKKTIKGGLCKTEPNKLMSRQVIIKGMRKNWGSEEKKQEKPSPCPQDVHRPRKETEGKTRAKAPHSAHWTIYLPRELVSGGTVALLGTFMDRVTQARDVSGDNCFWRPATSQQLCRP